MGPPGSVPCPPARWDGREGAHTRGHAAMFCFAAVGAGVNDFFVSAAAEFPSDCADDPEFADSCAKWAESNECNSNPQLGGSNRSSRWPCPSVRAPRYKIS